MRRAPAFWVLVLIALSPCSDPAAGTPADAWTVDELVKAEDVRELDLSPDGKLAVWARSTVDKVGDEEKRVSNLWLTRVDSGESVQLTRGTDTAQSPAFSRDGSMIAFLSTRPVPGGKAGELAESQLWVIPAGGGEAYPLTKSEREIRGFAWKDDRALVYAAPESASLWERERKERKDTAVVVEDPATLPVRLFRVELGEGKVVRLTRNADWIDGIAISPDGRHAVITAQQSLSYEYDQKVPPRTFLLDLETLRETPLFEDGKIRPKDVQWAADGSRFFLTNEFSRHPVYRTATITELWSCAIADGKLEKIDLGTERGLGGGYAPAPRGCLALLHDGVRYRLARFERGATGWKRTAVDGAHVANLDAIRTSRDGRILAYRMSSATEPAQWYTARLDGSALEDPRRITDLNKAFDAKPKGRAEVVRWKGARGEEVEGVLLYPLDRREATARPLVLDIHGGPTGVDRDTWSVSWASPHLLWRQKGAFVLQVNYHGSVGYGLDWAESIGAGNYYELEIPDIERGVDALIARGLVDPNKLATTGWSNGGILGVELITRSGRYKAASIGAADVEWISDWGNVDFGAAFDNYYFGASPLENPKLYIEKSPFFRLPSVTTPVIAFTGTEDRNVPPGESWSLFRALQQTGKVPVRLVLFPGEPHGLKKIAHQRRKLEEEAAWLDRYLFRTGTSPLDPVKKGSLLEGLLARAKAESVNGVLGRREGGSLVPETVPFQGLDVSRFEITRAQYAAFDRESRITPGEENLPVTGVSFAKAKAYAGWLAAKTGRSFRLPTRAEAERFAQAAGTGGNTLDRWAGYAPNPEEAARLVEVAESTTRPGSLLLPVGSTAGMGDPAVFDLDGNAAEWAADEKGKGVVVGPSADRSVDADAEQSFRAAYTGFRVVAE